MKFFYQSIINQSFYHRILWHTERRMLSESTYPFLTPFIFGIMCDAIMVNVKIPYKTICLITEITLHINGKIV